MTAVRRRLHPVPADPADPADPVDPEGPGAPGAPAGPPFVSKRRDEVCGEPLEREAEVLRALAGSPVVELVDCRTVGAQTELRTARAGTSTLQDAASLPPRNVLRAAAATCRSVVAVHRAGWGHGAVCPAHVVVGGRGRATLCSLGRAQTLVAAPQLVTVDRSATFATLLEVADLLERGPDEPARRRAAQALRRAVGPADQDLLDVAAALDAELEHLHDRWRPPVRAAVLAAGVLAGSALLAGAWTWTGRGAAPADAPGPAARSAPTATLPSGRARVGLPGDEHVVVDVDCDGDDEVLVLRPSTGELFVAPRVPDEGHAVRTVPAGHLPGATSLTTSTPADGCATPLATMSDGSTAPVDLGTGPAPVAAPPSTSLSTGPTPADATTTRRSQSAAAGPAPTSQPDHTAGPKPRAAPPTARPVPPGAAPARPPVTSPTTTEPPFEYPVSDVPAPDTAPSEEPA